MNLLHLQQVWVVAHTTHNRPIPITTQLNPTQPRLNTTPNLHHPTPTNHNPTPSNPHFIQPYPIQFHPPRPSHLHTAPYSHPYPNIPSIYIPIIYTHPPIHSRLHAYTFNCKQIINFIYLLYISIDILTFI